MRANEGHLSAYRTSFLKTVAQTLSSKSLEHSRRHRRQHPFARRAQQLMGRRGTVGTRLFFSLGRSSKGGKEGKGVGGSGVSDDVGWGGWSRNTQANDAWNRGVSPLMERTQGWSQRYTSPCTAPTSMQRKVRVCSSFMRSENVANDAMNLRHGNGTLAHLVN